MSSSGWALSLIEARPLGGERKKGADRGIDGVMTFSEHDSIQRILVSVKSGKPSLLHVKELIATLETEKGTIGVLMTHELGHWVFLKDLACSPGVTMCNQLGGGTVSYNARSLEQDDKDGANAVYP